jgi:hypothetical protein
MSLDTGLAMFQVYRFTRIRPALGRILLVLGIVVVTVGAPALIVVALVGNTTTGLLSATVLAGLLVLTYCWRDGDRLRIGELRALVPSRGQREDAGVTTR